jgi:TolA-binding protein
MQKEKNPLPNVQHENEVEALKTWLSKYGSHALTAVLTVLIALAALNLFHSRAARRALEANRRLASAQSVSDFENILADFGKSDVAPLAQLALAKLNFDNANYELALSQYDKFLTQWPAHPMKESAELGRIVCIEARGDEASIQEAKDAFSAFANQNPDSHLTPQALFGQARCLEQLGELESARAIYEDFIANHAESLWSIRAEELLAAVQRKLDRTTPQS